MAVVPQGAASKWVQTPFCAAVAAAKHFSPIVAPVPQPLPQRVNGLYVLLSIILTLVYSNINCIQNGLNTMS